MTSCTSMQTKTNEMTPLFLGFSNEYMIVYTEKDQAQPFESILLHSIGQGYTMHFMAVSRTLIFTQQSSTGLKKFKVDTVDFMARDAIKDIFKLHFPVNCISTGSGTSDTQQAASSQSTQLIDTPAQSTKPLPTMKHASDEGTQEFAHNSGIDHTGK